MEWVKTADRLPYHGQRVIVNVVDIFGNVNYIDIASFAKFPDGNGGCFFGENGSISLSLIPYWMPLPKPLVAGN